MHLTKQERYCCRELYLRFNYNMYYDLLDNIEPPSYRNSLWHIRFWGMFREII